MRAILVLKIVSIISTSSQSFNLNTLNGNSVSDRMTGLLIYFLRSLTLSELSILEIIILLVYLLLN